MSCIVLGSPVCELEVAIRSGAPVTVTTCPHPCLLENAHPQVLAEGRADPGLCEARVPPGHPWEAECHSVPARRVPGLSQGPGGERAEAGSVLLVIHGPAGPASKAFAWNSGARSSRLGSGYFALCPSITTAKNFTKSILALTCVSSLKPRTRNSGHRPGAGTETGLLPQGIPWGQTLSLRLFPHLAAVPCSPESLVICRKGRSLSRRLSLHSQTTSRDPGTVTLIQSVNKPLFASPCFGQMLD